MRVAVLTPPRGKTPRPDLADTFVQGEQVTAILAARGHEVRPATYGPDMGATEKDLRRLAPDLVFNLVEDIPEGPDKLHLVTALLEDLDLSYTGAGTAALEALGDKPRMKATLVDGGLPVAPDLLASEGTGRFIVKSRTEHASLGISDKSVVVGRIAAEAMIAARTAEFGGLWFAEEYIDGREFNVSVLETLNGPLLLPAAEIVFLDHAGDRPRIVGYEEKWSEGSIAYETTPRVFPTDSADAPLVGELERLALAAWRIFGLTGYARVDFRVDLEGRPYILEVNANPCIAADAGFCAAAAQAGLTQEDVISHIVATAHG